MKEAIFLQGIRQAVAEERANQLRWYVGTCIHSDVRLMYVHYRYTYPSPIVINCATLFVPRVTKLGGEAISDKEKEAILNARQEAQRLYQQVGSSPYAFTFLFDDPFPIFYPSTALTMLYLLKSPSFA